MSRVRADAGNTCSFHFHTGGNLVSANGITMDNDCTVLVIEDDADTAGILKEALELDGHEVQVAHDGPEGLAKARATRPEVVLCDIGLPGMDGYEVARAFGTDDALRGVLLVALTGHALPEDLERAEQAGFHRHLAKPPDFDRLAAILSEAARPALDVPPHVH